MFGTHVYIVIYIYITSHDMHCHSPLFIDIFSKSTFISIIYRILYIYIKYIFVDRVKHHVTSTFQTSHWQGYKTWPSCVHRWNCFCQKIAIASRRAARLRRRSRYINKKWLVVTGTWMDYDFPYIGNVIIPTDFHSIIFQRGRLKPPTR